MPQRVIDTAMWDDERFSDLSGDAQHVYLRLVTGPDTGPAGATRVRARRIAADTRRSEGKVKAALTELVTVGLVREYEGGWLWLPSWIKYQVSGPGFIKAVRRQAKECPPSLRTAIDRALNEHAPRHDPDRSSTPNVAKSREEGKGTPRQTPSQSNVPRGSIWGEVQDQDPSPPTGGRKGPYRAERENTGPVGSAGGGQPPGPGEVEFDEAAERAERLAAIREGLGASEITRGFLRVLEAPGG